MVEHSLTKWLTYALLLFVVLSCRPFTEYIAKPVGKAFDWDTEVKLSFIVDKNVNPDVDNSSRPSPVVIRVYELSSPDAFETADFRDIYFKDKEALGDSFLHKQRLKPFAPGTKRLDHFLLKEGTSFIGLFAEFSDYKDATFRIVMPVDEYLTTRQDIKLMKKNISLYREIPAEKHFNPVHRNKSQQFYR